MDLIPVAWETGVSIHFLGVFEKIPTQRCVLVLNNRSITIGTGFPRPGLLFSPLVSKFKLKVVGLFGPINLGSCFILALLNLVTPRRSDGTLNRDLVYVAHKTWTIKIPTSLRKRICDCRLIQNCKHLQVWALHVSCRVSRRGFTPEVPERDNK